jgi:two-component system, LytTR family, response regulator LytT
MEIIIIEDEMITAEELQFYLKELIPGVKIRAIFETIEDSLNHLSMYGSPDLIFSDIQLADGLSFEIFEQFQVTCPVIFCTAFDEYAIQAFNTNSIDYVLKPFDGKAIKKSIDKYNTIKCYFTQLEENGGKDDSKEKMERMISTVQPKLRSNFIVSSKGKYFPVSVQEISFFYTTNDLVYLYKKTGEKYLLNFNLDELEKCLSNKQFFRANRQFIVNMDEVKEFENHFNRKLSVKMNQNLPEQLLVSKEKSSTFIRWIESR